MNTEDREKMKDRVMDMVLTGYTHRQICKRLDIGLRAVAEKILLALLPQEEYV